MVEGDYHNSKHPSVASTTKDQLLVENMAKREEDSVQLDLYMRTQPNTSFCTQLTAMIVRRYLVFFREPRQWFMIIGPFINVLSLILLIDVFVLAISGNASPETRKIM